MVKGQCTPERLRRVQRRCAEAAQLVDRVTPGEVDDYAIPGFLHGSGLSRAKSGQSNPVHRVDVLLEAMHQAGRSMADAEAIAAHVQAVVLELWADELPDYRTAMRHEAVSDSSEDVLQLDAAFDRTRLGRWVQAAELHVADSMVAIAAARRELGSQHVRVAA